MKYAVVIEKAPKNYSAYVPDVPGCIATGPTVAETKRLLAEAIELHLESMVENGQSIPAAETVTDQVEVHVPQTAAVKS